MEGGFGLEEVHLRVSHSRHYALSRCRRIQPAIQLIDLKTCVPGPERERNDSECTWWRTGGPWRWGRLNPDVIKSEIRIAGRDNSEASAL